MDISQHDRQLTVDADVANLGRVRDHVASVASSTGACPEVVEQLRLVVSELATNAVQYDSSGTLTVVIRSDETGWTLDVSNADGLVNIDAPKLPKPSEPSGRGLYLVDAIMDRVELVEIDGRRHIRCVKFTD